MKHVHNINEIKKLLKKKKTYKAARLLQTEKICSNARRDEKLDLAV